MSFLGTKSRDGADDYPWAVDFSLVDVFEDNPVTSATATVVFASNGDTAALVLGSPSVAANVVTFRVSGGVEGVRYVVAVRATNSASPPNVVERSFALETEPL